MMKLIRTFSDTTKHTVKSVVEVINNPDVCAYQSLALFMGKRDSFLTLGDRGSLIRYSRKLTLGFQFYLSVL